MNNETLNQFIDAMNMHFALVEKLSVAVEQLKIENQKAKELLK